MAIDTATATPAELAALWRKGKVGPGKNPAAVALGRKGGLARAKSLGHDRMAEIARKAAADRLKRAQQYKAWTGPFSELVKLGPEALAEAVVGLSADKKALIAEVDRLRKLVDEKKAPASRSNGSTKRDSRVPDPTVPEVSRGAVPAVGGANGQSTPQRVGGEWLARVLKT